MVKPQLLALALFGLLLALPQPAACQAWSGSLAVDAQTQVNVVNPVAPEDSLLGADGVAPLVWLDNQCQAPVLSWQEDDAERLTTLWSSPLKLAWDRVDTVRYHTSLDTSYSPPNGGVDPGMGSYLQGDRFRAWLRSGVEWRYTRDAVLSVDTRWSIAGLDGVDPASPFHAAATVTVVW